MSLHPCSAQRTPAQKIDTQLRIRMTRFIHVRSLTRSLGFFNPRLGRAGLKEQQSQAERDQQQADPLRFG